MRTQIKVLANITRHLLIVSSIGILELGLLRDDLGVSREPGPTRRIHAVVVNRLLCRHHL